MAETEARSLAEFILGHIDIGIVVVDRSYRIVLWNHFMESHTGRHCSEVLQQPLLDSFPELPRIWLEKKLKAVFKLGSYGFTNWRERPYLFHMPHNRPITGGVDSMRQSCTLIPIKGADGSIDHICIVVKDVTDTALSEVCLHEALSDLESLHGIVENINRELRLEKVMEALLEQGLRLLPEMAKGAFFIRDDERGLFEVAAVSGWDMKQLTGVHLSIAEALGRYSHASDRLDQDMYIVRDIGSRPGANKMRHLPSEEVLLTMSLEVDQEIVGFLVFDLVANPKEISGTDLQRLKLYRAHAVSALHKARIVRELEKQRRQAEQANLAKTAFLSTMSHEIRTPLNAILGFAQIMRFKEGRSEEDRESLDIIDRSGQYLLTLINDVLSMAKIEAGHLTLNENTFELGGLVRDLYQMFITRAEDKGLRLDYSVEPMEPMSVRGDDGKLRQVLANLMANAIKFTESGGVTVRVQRADDGPTRFEVEDTGPGIAEDDTERIFLPFDQTEQGAMVQGGTGLGLSISRSFVQLMGGDISLQTRLGRGSVFSFEIDLPEVGSGVVTVHGDEHQVTGLARDQRSWRILVVDDKDENRLLLVKLMSEVGLDVRQATNGREAVAIWEEWRPHLIWMDMRMPVMDGSQATREIRRQSTELRLEPKPVIIALTASAFENDRQPMLAAGCDNVVAKPFREATIFNMLSSHLGVHWRLQDREQELTTAHPASLDRDRVAAQPLAWRIELHQALTDGDVESAHQIIDRLAIQDRPLCESLHGLIKSYRFDLVQEVIGPIPEHLASQESEATTKTTLGSK